VAGAGGHRGGLEDDGVTAGGQPDRHVLKDMPRSLEEEESRRKTRRKRREEEDEHLFITQFYSR